MESFQMRLKSQLRKIYTGFVVQGHIYSYIYNFLHIHISHQCTQTMLKDSPPPPPPPHFIQTIFIKDIIYMQSKVLSQLIASKIKVCLRNLCVLCIFVYINTHTSIRVWTYTDLTVRLRLSCHRFNSISWCITVNWQMHRILNFQFYLMYTILSINASSQIMTWTFNFICSKKTGFLNV